MAHTFNRDDGTFGAIASTDQPPVIGFCADKNGSDQTGIADITFTKVTFGTESFDSGSYYDAANSKWVPPAGKVLISSGVLVSATITTGKQISIAIYKNGSDFRQGNWIASSTLGGGAGFISFVDQANGTDYYEVYVYVDVDSGTATVSGTVQNSFFSGAWLGP